MSQQRELSGRVRSWLREDGREDADRVLYAVLDQLDTTPQRHAGWLARRFSIMNTNTFRFGIAAVAVIALAAIGWRFLPLSNTGTPPVNTPYPSTASIALTPADVNVPLAGGRYSLVVGAQQRQLGVDVTLPSGWVPLALTVGEASFQASPDNTYPYLGFFSVRGVYRDPCHPEEGYAGERGLGTHRLDRNPTAGDLVDQLRGLAGFTSTEASTLTLGGMNAWHFAISNTIDTDSQGCTDGDLLPLFVSWDGNVTSERTKRQHSPATNGGTSQEVWVVDRVGVPVLIVADFGDSQEQADRDTVEQILSSLAFD